MIKFLYLQKVTQKYAEDIHEVVDWVVDSGWYIQGKENERLAADYASYIGNSVIIWNSLTRKFV